MIYRVIGFAGFLTFQSALFAHVPTKLLAVAMAYRASMFQLLQEFAWGWQQLD